MSDMLDVTFLDVDTGEPVFTEKVDVIGVEHDTITVKVRFKFWTRVEDGLPNGRFSDEPGKHKTFFVMLYDRYVTTGQYYKDIGWMNGRSTLENMVIAWAEIPPLEEK